jgi:hypothetical protein
MHFSCEVAHSSAQQEQASEKDCGVNTKKSFAEISDAMHRNAQKHRLTPAM